MDQCRIYGDVFVQPQITAMEARQQEFNARINLLVPSKVWYIHHVQDSGSHDVHSPWLGDDLRLIPFGIGQILVWGEHSMVLAISQVEVIDIQCHDLS
jgi:hypothetical protein